ncbi:MAG: CRISPR-associated exonuclease Cas4 [Thermoanaerobaculia bacterium]|jgi:CRISPR-associated exonuclease Cas4|nr:CRISPR-associated exonuclease Cas4 [Thermoanaerobaculia bacterium]
MFSEDDLLPISALQHVVYCDRQAALIHVERMWSENSHTVEGRHAHAQAHEAGGESRGSVRIVRALPLRSLAAGLTGVADVVEFHRQESGAELPGRSGRWRIFPVEYKKGKPKRHRADEVQLCAQAICLEEMFSTEIAEGALYYGKTRRRKIVTLDEPLRIATLGAAARFREIVEQRLTPAAKWGPKCRQCSLLDDCRPRVGEKSARLYLAALIGHIEEPV